MGSKVSLCVGEAGKNHGDVKFSTETYIQTKFYSYYYDNLKIKNYHEYLMWIDKEVHESDRSCIPDFRRFYIKTPGVKNDNQFFYTYNVNNDLADEISSTKTDDVNRHTAKLTIDKPIKGRLMGKIGNDSSKNEFKYSFLDYEIDIVDDDRVEFTVLYAEPNPRYTPKRTAQIYKQQKVKVLQ